MNNQIQIMAVFLNTHSKEVNDFQTVCIICMNPVSFGFERPRRNRSFMIAMNSLWLSWPSSVRIQFKK